MGEQPPKKASSLRQKNADAAGTRKTPVDVPVAEPIENVVARIPAVQLFVKKIESSGRVDIFTRFMSELYPKLSLPKSSQYILDAFSSRDVTAEKVSVALKENAFLQQVFFQVIESVGKRQDIPSIEAAVVLLGMQNSRNLIIALQSLRTTIGAQPEWDKDGKLKTKPSDLLKFAIKTEEALATVKDEYGDLAFSAGLLFDLFTLIASQSENKKKLQNYIDLVYAQGIKTASIAAEIVKASPELGSRRVFFAACLLHDVGKIAMAILDPSYLDFIEQCTKKDLSRSIRRFAEANRFGINHSVLGAVICYEFSLFAPFARAVLYQHEPFLLATRKKSIYELTALVSLSTNIASQFKIVDKIDDPILAQWKGPELKDLKLDPRNLIKALGRVKI